MVHHTQTHFDKKQKYESFERGALQIYVSE